MQKCVVVKKSQQMTCVTAHHYLGAILLDCAGAYLKIHGHFWHSSYFDILDVCIDKSFFFIATVIFIVTARYCFWPFIFPVSESQTSQEEHYPRNKTTWYILDAAK